MVVYLYWVIITLPRGSSEQEDGPAIAGGFLACDGVRSGEPDRAGSSAWDARS